MTDVSPSGHPALAGRERAMAELADEVRALVELAVTNGAPVAVLERVLGQLRSATGVLRAERPSEPHPRFVDPSGTGRAEAGVASMIGSMPFDLVVGRYNPLALPVDITFEPPLAIGMARFTTPYEGGPGWVHGAAIAATFDMVLTAANHLAGAAGPTVRLVIHFRRPTLVGIDARFEAEVVHADGRRVTSKGRLVQDGIVCVEAEGEFATLDVKRILERTRAHDRDRRTEAPSSE